MSPASRFSRKARWLCAALPLAALAAPREASAFCGFYVSGADTKLFNDATQVVLMRDGTRTVLSMQNSYQGPPEDFAMVVPVPVVLQKENVQTLTREVFERVDKLGAPRLVEYWEQDPCKEGIGLGTIGTIGRGMGFGSGSGRLGGSHHEVVVHAQFAVGEYEIVILGASDALSLDTWLRDHNYKIPAGAEPMLRPYVEAGSKFFVAKVDVSKVRFEGGRAALSPLRFFYDSEKFELPIRLGLINAGGAQDLIINILAKGQRYEAANYPNVTIPTNLDVTDATRDVFGSFYAALFDQTLRKTPRAVVTEYAWASSTCDPCPGPALTRDDLITLGADSLPDVDRRINQPGVRVEPPEQMKGGLPPEVVGRIVRQGSRQFLSCYEENSKPPDPRPKGRLVVDLTIDLRGRVAEAQVAPSSTLNAPALEKCALDAIKKLSFPSPEKIPVTALIPVRFSSEPGIMGLRDFVLTRLHARYTPDSLGDDLVFRPAPPIVGGREVRKGETLEEGAEPSSNNNFQGRYVIRHAWSGELPCATPRRGIWGGPPAGSATASPRAATDAAHAPRGASLAKYLATSVPDLETPPPPSASAPPPAPSAAPAQPASPRACGCRAAGHAAGGPLAPSALAALALGALRRARRPPASRG